MGLEPTHFAAPLFKSGSYTNSDTSPSKMNRRKWSDADLITAVASNHSIAGVARSLGLRPAGGNYKTIKHRVHHLQLDTSHWKGKGWLKGTHVRTSPKRTLDEILIEDSPTTHTSHLKHRLISEGVLSNHCSTCGITTWREEPLSLHLDHINGIGTDNRLQNLRLLCPNCHSQTATYCGRNIGKVLG